MGDLGLLMKTHFVMLIWLTLLNRVKKTKQNIKKKKIVNLTD